MLFHRFIRLFSDSNQLDSWFMRPVANLVANLFPTRKNFRSRNASCDPKAIFLVKLSGLGSIVNTLPLLQSLRQRYPRTTLVYLSWESNRDIVSRVQEIDRFIGLDKESAWRFLKTLLQGIIAIRRLSPELALDLQIYKTPAFTSLLTRFSGARRTIAFIRPGQEFRRGLLHVTVPFNERLPLPHSFEQLGAESGISGRLQPHPPLVIQNRDRQELTAMEETGTGMPRLLIINPNASAFCLERRWPLLFFSETASHLMNRFPDLTVFLIGSRHERPYVERLEESINRVARVQNMAGRLTIGGVLALLDKANCFLTNDSGPMHLGFVMRTPTVALFGPADPINHSIHAHPDRSTLFYKETPCSPCVHQFSSAPCSGHNVCMQTISPVEVSNSCMSYLEALRRNVPRPAHSVSISGQAGYAFQPSMAKLASQGRGKRRQPPYG